MAFIQFHKDKKLKPEYEYGFYAGSLFTCIVILIVFALGYFQGSNTWSIGNFVTSLIVINIFLFLWAKARSGNILVTTTSAVHGEVKINHPAASRGERPAAILENFERKSRRVLIQLVFLGTLLTAVTVWLIWISGDLLFILYFTLPILGLVLSIKQLLIAPSKNIFLASETSYRFFQIFFYVLIALLIFTGFAISMAFIVKAIQHYGAVDDNLTPGTFKDNSSMKKLSIARRQYALISYGIRRAGENSLPQTPFLFAREPISQNRDFLQNRFEF